MFVVIATVVVILTIVALIGIAIGITALIRTIRYKRASNGEKLKLDVENIKRELLKQSATRLEDRGLL